MMNNFPSLKTNVVVLFMITGTIFRMGRAEGASKTESIQEKLKREGPDCCRTFTLTEPRFVTDERILAYITRVKESKVDVNKGCTIPGWAVKDNNHMWWCFQQIKSITDSLAKKFPKVIAAAGGAVVLTVDNKTVIIETGAKVCGNGVNFFGSNMCTETEVINIGTGSVQTDTGVKHNDGSVWDGIGRIVWAAAAVGGVLVLGLLIVCAFRFGWSKKKVKTPNALNFDNWHPMPPPSAPLESISFIDEVRSLINDMNSEKELVPMKQIARSSIRGYKGQQI